MVSNDELPMIAAATAPFFRKFSDKSLSLVEDVIAGRLSAAQIIARGKGPAYQILALQQEGRAGRKPAHLPADSEHTSEVR
jgi:hypothetical protein